MSGEVAIPVWLRVGPAPERMIGTVTIDVTKDIAEGQRTALAGLLRGVADEIESGEMQ